jgi:acyl carrier protein
VESWADTNVRIVTGTRKGRDEMTQDAAEIRDRIKQIIANVAGLDSGKIGDEARLRDELKLDSLSLLEIGVDVDLAFKLELPDERYKEIDSIPDMVALVQGRVAERQTV